MDVPTFLLGVVILLAIIGIVLKMMPFFCLMKCKKLFPDVYHMIKEEPEFNIKDKTWELRGCNGRHYISDDGKYKFEQVCYSSDFWEIGSWRRHTRQRNVLN